MQLLHNYFILFFIISCLMVYFSVNPVHSVLFLILTFINAFFILLLFKVEFLALLFIIVYVGAIAVLFLFIVMMLNIKKELFSLHFNSFFFVISFACVFVLILRLDFFSFETGTSFSDFNFIWFDSFGDITSLGQSLYNYYLVLVLLGGLILLIGMVGAIVLTLEFKSAYGTENSFRQLSRTQATLNLYY